MSTVQCSCGNWLSTQLSAADGTIQCPRCGQVVSVVPSGQQVTAAFAGGYSASTYGSGPAYNAAQMGAANDENTAAIVGFVLSLLSLFGCLILAPVGAIVSYFGLSKPTNRGLAIAGLIIGLIQTLALVGVIAYFVVVFLFIGGVAVATTGAIASAAASAAQQQAISRTQMSMEVAVQAVASFKEANDRLPDQAEGDQLVGSSVDAWGHVLIYELTEESANIVSRGEDGLQGTADDLTRNIDEPAPDPFRGSQMPRTLSLDEALVKLQSSDRAERIEAEMALDMLPIDESRRTEVVQVLLSRMEFPDEQRTAVRFLRRWMGPEQTGMVRDYMQQAPEDTSTSILSDLTLRLREQEAFEELVTLSNHPDRSVRMLSRQSLRGEPEWIVPVIKQCLSDMDQVERREAALEQLMRWPLPDPMDDGLHDEVCNKLNPYLNDSDPKLRRYAHETIERWGAKPVNIEQLLMADRLDLLTEFQDRRILEHLGRKLENWPVEFNQAAEHCRRIGPAAEAIVWPALEKAQLPANHALIRLLGEIGTERSIERLEPLLESRTDKLVTEQAIEQIRAAKREPADW